ncbi:GlxA family transcriptional regulator [Actinomadura parmotrematis]|uniref:Helix-turn-helix domain-containing protein n=1 Tax=Actinomadura parmotrematis TaxID=2864039 RepID=A0ABS7FX78_9ACTN|nr:helix-turn-helix domain-containing protein [Actinomadura parmotrematis]MBW8484284.1 helix-turn-helix domain-containing protein [Actinomadura parmotrematis]
MDIAVLAYDGVRLLDVTGPLEVFSTAARFGVPYTVRLCSPDGGPVATSAGVRLETAAPPARAHTLIVPGTPELPAGRPPARVVETVAGFRAERYASVCTGAFVLAEAGLLDGRRATTHWRHAAALARRYPSVEVEPDAVYVRSGAVLTSAGVSAGVDLSLALVEDDAGAGPARDVARDLVVFLRRPGGQSQFSVAARTPSPSHAALGELVREVAAAPAADHSLAAMAGRAGLSVRHLTRLFHRQIGSTPAAYVEAVRLEAARMMLDSGETVTGAAARSGMGSDETLRRAFIRHLGVTPSAYRSRFRSSGDGS